MGVQYTRRGGRARSVLHGRSPLRHQPGQTGATRGRAFECVLAFASCAALAGVAWLAFGDPLASLSPSPGASSPAEAVIEQVAVGAANENPDGAREPIGFEVRYGRDIRPLLSDRCFSCHGQDPATRAAGLRLDERDGAIADRDGVRAIVPGDASASDLWKRITSHDPAERMPPPEAEKRPLTEDDLALIRAWIEQGASYEPHWAFEPPVRHDVPPVVAQDWSRDEIDRFVLAKMEASGVSPAPQASPETLLRRVFLDLTGLPPTPAELDAFLDEYAGDAEVAYRHWVDRLLGEEPYVTRVAERLTVPWLDAARYADTIGIHTDAGRQMWLWRDWVIEAFRSNMPYDRFITEQLAGDLVPDATVQQKVASGFNRSHVITDEGGAIDDEYLVEYAVDRTDTTSAVFLGLTMGCARCHDHKYDPISAEDYYGLFAFFNSNDEPGLYSQQRNPNRAFEPSLAVPTPEQRARLDELDAEIASLLQRTESPGEDVVAARAAYFERASSSSRWASPRVEGVRSEGGATLEILADGSVEASGTNPDNDIYEFVLTVDEAETAINAVLIEALPATRSPDAGTPGPSNRAGRSNNGNAVLTGLRFRLERGGETRTIEPAWAWADVEQSGVGYPAIDALTPGPDAGWGIAGHEREGARALLVLLDEAIELGPDARLTVRMEFESEWHGHAFARVRTSLASIDPPDGLFPAFGTWRRTAPFTGPPAGELFDTAFGPESATRLDSDASFGSDDHRWMIARDIRDGEVHAIPDPGAGVSYFTREVFAPRAVEVPVSLGSDDGFRLFLNGEEIASRNVERGAAPDQDSAVLPLRAGRNTLVMKIVNTGGPGGLYFRPVRPVAAINDLAAAVLPERLRSEPLLGRAREAWHRSPASPTGRMYLRLDELRAEAARVEEESPRTMVMEELAEARQTYVLTRGMYDHPDGSRPVERSVPRVLGTLPEDAPANRLGLARWLTSAENPLVARVAVNRFWMMLFGEGIVRTPEDFGLQGAWPTHPELLDTLAVDFRESGWDVCALLRRIVLSATYRQDGAFRPGVHETDPENELLARYPSRRLWAEQIRDQALYVAGLLVERTGGPSVKPYQPAGLWREVAMPASNTRDFVRGSGEDLYRRSLYTYWKRAAPPPAMRAFDAPTREFCTVQRATTDTPLQALVLWNDEQFVEAARVLAARVLTASAAEGGDADDDRIAALYRRCTALEPGERERGVLGEALGAFRERFAASPEDAAALVSIGESMAGGDLPEPELAAWTMVASTVMNLYRVTTQE